MKKGWFTHSDLTAEQATELVARYTAKHVETEKCLAPDYKSWILSARLPEPDKPPRVDKTHQWRQRE